MRTKRLTGFAAVAIISLSIAACGSDNNESSSSVGATTPPAAGTDSTTAPDTAAPDTAAPDTAAPDTAAPDTTGGDLAGLELAQARLDEFTKPITDLGMTDTVPVPAGLKVAYVQCSVPVCESIKQGIAEAVDAIGGTLETFPTQDTADTVQAAFQAAVQSEPDMVMTSGNPREWFEDSLAELNDKSIPVVGWSIPEPYITDGFAANLITGDDYFFNGVLMADYVTAKTEGKANVLYLNIPQFPVLGLEGDGFRGEMEAACDGCKVTSLEFTVEQLIAGEHISAAISEFQKDPDINFLVTGFGDMLLGMPDALSGIDVDVPAISQAGTPANYQLIADGQLQVADVALPTGLLGWRAVDAGLRAIAGQDPGSFEHRPFTDIDGHPDINITGVPLAILGADDISDPTIAWPGMDGYQDVFKALWILG